MLVDLGGVWGGQEVYAKNLALALSERDIHVTHVSAHEVHRIGAARFIHVSNEYISFPSLCQLLTEESASQDIVHFNGTRAIYASLFIRKCAPFIATKHSPHLLSVHGAARVKAASLLIRAAMRKLNKIICVSEAVFSEFVATATSNKPVLIRNGVPDLGMSNLNSFTEKLEVCFVGRLIREKGVMVFLSGVALAVERGVDLVVRVAGVGPLEPEVLTFVRERGLERRVHLLGHVSNMSAVYGSSHVCVLPSVHEGLPLSLLEASSSGCALIGSNIGGIREVIQDGFNGILIGPSPDTLADAFIKINQDRELLHRLRTNARLDFEQKWGLGRMVSATIDVYRGEISRVVESI